MMNSYFSTFLTGFSNVVRQEIKNDLPDIKIDLLLDGLIVYRTDADKIKIKNLPYLNNSFILLKLIKDASDKPFSDIKTWISESNDFEKLLKDALHNSTESIKLNFVEENQYIHINNIFVEKISNLIIEKGGVVLDRYLGKKELWFISRSEGSVMLGLRITSHGDYEKTLQKGELKPELAFLLCSLSNPSDQDIFMDPFAGSGSIPHQRKNSFLYKKIIASDIDPKIVESLIMRLKDSDIEVKRQDTLKLAEVSNKSIDKIVTDPPWGIFGIDKINIGNFYSRMFRELHRVLKDDGILVLLISRFIDLETILESNTIKFKIELRINTLVNGQKATVYRLIKNN